MKRDKNDLKIITKTEIPKSSVTGTRLGDQLRANRCVFNVLHAKLPRHDYNLTAARCAENPEGGVAIQSLWPYREPRDARRQMTEHQQTDKSEMIQRSSSNTEEMQTFYYIVKDRPI